MSQDGLLPRIEHLATGIGITRFDIDVPHQRIEGCFDGVWEYDFDEETWRFGDLSFTAYPIRYLTVMFDDPYFLNAESSVHLFEEVAREQSALIAKYEDSGTSLVALRAGPPFAVTLDRESYLHLRHFRFMSNSLNAEWLCESFAAKIDYKTPRSDWVHPSTYTGPFIDPPEQDVEGSA